MGRGRIAWNVYGRPKSSLYLIVMTSEGVMLLAEYRDCKYINYTPGYPHEEIKGVTSFINDEKLYDAIRGVYANHKPAQAGGEARP